MLIFHTLVAGKSRTAIRLPGFSQTNPSVPCEQREINPLEMLNEPALAVPESPRV